MKPKILITREISRKQEELCAEFGLEPIVHSFIDINNLDVNDYELVKLTQECDIWIFTSVNAVKSFLRFENLIDVTDKTAYAIGEKTEQELKRLEGLSIIVKDEYAVNFFQEIKKENVGKPVAYFCGNLSIEKNKHVITEFEKIVLYETQFLTKKIEETYDAVAFFSPSAVKAFSKSGNVLSKDVPVFALGGITMSEVFMHFQNTVFIPNEKKFESVMEDVKNYFYQQK